MIPSHYSQHNPSWADLRLGGSGETLGEAGCLVCSVATALRSFRMNETPASLHAKLINANAFTKNGWLIWSALRRIYGPYLTIDIPSSYSTSILTQAFAEQKIPIVKFTLPKHQPHWVIATACDPSGLTTLDPLHDQPQRLTTTPEAIRLLSWNIDAPLHSTQHVIS